MAINLFGAQAHGGKLIALDDQALVTDLAALAGTGGNTFAAFVLSGRFASAGYAKLRRMIQAVAHAGAVTVTITPWRDGQDTGQTITRTLAIGDNENVTAPLSVTGSDFQLMVTLTAFDAPASLGSGDITVVPRRSQR